MPMKIKVGDKASQKKSFTDFEIKQFAKLSNDSNPIHHDLQVAQRAGFDRPIVQGFLVAGLFGGLMGSELPGKGTLYMGHNMSFKAPVYVDEEINAVIEVISVREDKPIVIFRTIAYKPDGTIAIEGEAVMMVREV